MKPEQFLNGRVSLYGADSRDVLRVLPDDSIDSIVTDPPYALVSIVKRFANSPRSEKTENTENPYGRTGRGFMGQKWDTGETAFATEFWAECLRVLKPGGHVVAFSGTRTVHRMVCAIEDAGFEIRDQLSWMYGSGFPKSHDVSKGIDKVLGKERTKVRHAPRAVSSGTFSGSMDSRPWIESARERGFHEAVSDEAVSDEAVSDEAVEWQGWGTALKPATEPICLARKPLSEKTVAANVLRWRTGALNIGACRVEAPDGVPKFNKRNEDSKGILGDGLNGSNRTGEMDTSTGRWPANVVHDGSDEVVGAFPDNKGSTGVFKRKASLQTDSNANVASRRDEHAGVGYGDEGSAARFFYTAKADTEDRLGSRHPTVKPVDLIQWLVRLVTPKGGLVLDPFAGTGTTAEAAFREGASAIIVERETEYLDDIRRRMGLVLGGPEERRRESIKAKTKGTPIDAGPLFGGT